MKWAFIDYENVGSLERVNLVDYQRLFVFCGPKNKSIKFETIPADGICHIELLSIMTGGRDNLDFHLAFHLGKEHQLALLEIQFDIVSNDTGFNGLVNHVKRLGRACKRLDSLKSTKKIAIESKKPTKKAGKSVGSNKSLTEPAAKLLEKLKGLDGRVRTKKKDRLLGWLKSNIPALHLSNAPAPQAVFEELVRAGFIAVDEKNSLTYDFSL